MATTATSSLEQCQQQQTRRNSTNNDEEEAGNETTTSSSSSSSRLSPSATTRSESVVYDVEHLATFSTATANHEANSKDISTSDNGSCSDEKIKQQFTNIESRKQSSTTSPKVALQRLFKLEKLSGIWTQHMQIELRNDSMLIVDCETNSVVERFNRECVTKPEAFNQYNDIYNNIVVFIIQQPKEGDVGGENNQDSSIDNSNEEGELHIFQCVSHKAQQLVTDILTWKSSKPVNAGGGVGDIRRMSSNNENNSSVSLESPAKVVDKRTTTTTLKDQESITNREKSYETSTNTTKSNNMLSSTSNCNGGKPVVTVASSASTGENVPIVNVNVKETVQVFNQIAALREKSKPVSPINHNNRPVSDASTTSSHSTPGGSSTAASNGNEPSRAPLNFGGQLYKQRSIRATLAPKHVIDAALAAASTSGEQQTKSSSSQAKGEPQSSNNSASCGSSSSMGSSDTKPIPYTLHSLDNHGGAAGGSASSNRQMPTTSSSSSGQNDAEHVKQVSAKNGAHGSSRTNSSSQQQVPPNQVAHKSSRSLVSRGQQQQQQQSRSQSDSSRSQASLSSQSQLDQVSTNESYVSVLNHCFDDIEKFIIRLQQAVAGQAALRELQAKRKLSKRSSQVNNRDSGAAISNPPVTASEMAMLSARARGPSEDDYFEILSKFKLAFNLLAKLKGCIHEPNAPELVHFLFTPLVIIIESARNASPPIDPTLVGIPYLNQDALDLLSNCCTSKESDMWISLGPNWTQTIDMNILKASRLPSSFQPIFSDGWAPIIGELELIGLVAPATLNQQHSSVSSVLTNECVTSSELNEPHHLHHHHHESNRRNQQQYMMDDPSISDSKPLDHSVHSVGVSNGRSDGSKSHSSRRDFKALPSSSYGRRQDALEPLPYLNSMPYGYRHDFSIDSAHSRDPQGYRMPPDNMRSSRYKGGLDKQQPRRSKHNSRQPDYPHPSGYDTSQYPTLTVPRSVDEDSRLDVDLLHHHPGNVGMVHSDDYSDLHDQYLDDHHLGPGPSGAPYRRDKNHNHPRHSRKSEPNPTHSHHYSQHPILPPFETDYFSEAEHEDMLIDLGPTQTEWLFELQSRGAMVVRVLFTRDANNDKELSVSRGEVLEVLDDTRKWWRARNIDLQVAYVPHTIVAVMHGYQTLDELLAINQSDLIGEDPSLMPNQRFLQRDMQTDSYARHQRHDREDKRNSKTAGAFRYF